MSFIESTRGSHVDREQLELGTGGEGSVGRFICFLSIGCRPGTNGAGRGFTASGSQSLGGEYSLCAASTE